MYREKRQYDQALADYAKAIELNPQFDLPYLNLGLMAYNNGQYEQALTDYTRAIELNQRRAAHSSIGALSFINRPV